MKCDKVVVGYCVYCPTTKMVLGKGGIARGKPHVYNNPAHAKMVITQRKTHLAKLDADNHYKMYAQQKPIVDGLRIVAATADIWE